MSWDVLIVNRGGNIGPSKEDEPSGPLGPAPEVRTKIAAALPGTDWSDPNWGVYETDDFSIEFPLSEDEVIDSLTMTIRGGGDVAPALVQLAQATNWSLLDTTTNEYLDPHQPSTSSWKASETYRDEVTTEVQASLSEMTGGPPRDLSNDDPNTLSTAETMAEETEPRLLDRTQPEMPHPVGKVEPLEPMPVDRPVKPSPRDAREAKIATPRKSPAKKSPAKKSPAKTTPVKKTTVRRTKKAVKKTPKKAAPKKVVVRKKAVLRGKAPAKKKVAARKAPKGVKKAGRPAKKAARAVKKVARGMKRTAKKVARKAAKKRGR